MRNHHDKNQLKREVKKERGGKSLEKRQTVRQAGRMKEERVKKKKKKGVILASDSGGLESTVVGVIASCRHGRRRLELQDLISTTSRKQRVNGRWVRLHTSQSSL